MKPVTLFAILLLLTSCSSPRTRFLLGAGIGGLSAGGTATALSPNSQSRGMNALVFGLVGALIGGAVGLLVIDDGKVSSSTSSLRAKELDKVSPSNLFTVPLQTDLPAFVKDRIQPPVVEELTEPDTVSEDGSLHEPHKIYRIQRNAELYASPDSQQKKGTN